MRKSLMFLLLACGYILGTLQPSANANLGVRLPIHPTVIAGGNGYLEGYDVMVGGERACSDPYVWENVHEIDCR